MAFTITNGQAAVYSASPDISGDLVIPATHNGVPVTSIADDGFIYCTGLTSVTIPSSVTAIGHFAFFDCTGLTSITIPNSVTSIGNQTFGGCTGLTSINIINSVTSIGSGAFDGCTGITTPLFDVSQTALVYYPPNLPATSYVIPNSVTRILDFAFNNCSNLTNISIPNSVIFIGKYSFSLCSGLTSVSIPNSVTSIGSYAFYDCKNLTAIAIPNTVTSIGSYAFYNCRSLTAIVIPNSVTSIGGNAFYGCTNLRNVFFHPGLFFGSSALGLLPNQIDITAGFNGTTVDNPAFISAIAAKLAANDAFISAVANRIVTATGNYGIAVKTELQSAITESRTAGINSVLSAPGSWNLYTAAQIQEMSVGHLVLTRNENGTFVLNYDIEQSADLIHWTPFQATSLPLNSLPTDKAFVRIRTR